MPAELVLLSFSRAEFRALHKAATAGDEQAVQQIDSIWEEYKDREIECFICGRECEHPPFALMLPEPNSGAQVIAAPLCPACRDLDPMRRWGRALKLLGKMHQAKTGRQCHFNLMPRQR